VIETIDEYLYKNNFSVKEKKYLAASEGQRIIGKVFLDYPDAEMGFSIFYKNSLDGSMSFGIAAGAHTFICSNGSVYGDILSYKRRHIGKSNSDIIEQIQVACNSMEETMALHKKKRTNETKRNHCQATGQNFVEDCFWKRI
jgi:hypothetical protein